MNHNVTILKILDNEYRLSGKVIGLEHFSKSVEVEGEIYSKEWVEEVCYNLDELFEIRIKDFRWRCIEIDDFVFLGLPIYKFWTFSNADYFLRGTVKSENGYIRAIQILSEIGAIPYDVFCGKSDFYKGFYNRPIADGIEVNILGYGFNNCVCIYLPYHEVIKLNIPDDKISVSHKYKNLFPNKWQRFTDEQKTDLVINYINNLN